MRPAREAGIFSVGRGCRGSPADSKPPFSFRLRRKENAPFDGVREKALAAQPALRASWRKCGGLPNRCRRNLLVFCRVRSTLAVVGTAPPQLAEPRQSSWGGRSQGLSFYSRAFRFAMRYPGSPERTVPSFPQLPGCGSKRKRRGIRAGPHLRSSVTARVRQQKRTAGHPGGTRSSVGVKSEYRRQSPQISTGPKPP